MDGQTALLFTGAIVLLEIIYLVVNSNANRPPSPAMILAIALLMPVSLLIFAVWYVTVHRPRIEEIQDEKLRRSYVSMWTPDERKRVTY